MPAILAKTSPTFMDDRAVFVLFSRISANAIISIARGRR